MSGALVADAWLLGRFGRNEVLHSSGRLFAVALSACLVAVIAVATVAAPKVLATTAERSAGLTPVLAAEDGDAVLTLFDPPIYHDVAYEHWNGHEIARQFVVADSGQAPDALGIPEVPDVGHYYASPRLAELIRSDPVVGALFDGKTAQGLISQQGLVHPRDLRAIVGVAPGTGSDYAQISRFGDVPGEIAGGLGTAQKVNLVTAILVGVALWIPATSLLILVSRMGGMARRRQVRGLHHLGLSRLRAMVLASNDVLVAAFVGALIGVAGSWIWTQGATGLPGTDAGFFAVDADPGVVGGIAIVGFVAVLAGFSSASATWRTSRRAARARGARWGVVGAVMLVLGLTYLVAFEMIYAALGSATIIGLWAAIGVVAVGLMLAGPALVTAGFGLAAPLARHGGTLIAVRQRASGTSTSMRLGALIAVVIIALVTSMSFINILQQGGREDGLARLASESSVPLLVRSDGGLTAPALHDALGVPVASQSTVELKDSALELVVADCPTLAALGGAGLDACTGETQWMTRDGGPGRDDVSLVDVAGSAVHLPDPTNAVDLGGTLPAEWDGAVLVPPSAADGLAGEIFYAVVPGHTLGESVAAVSGVDSTADVRYLVDGEWGYPDRPDFPTQTAWIVAAGTMAIIIAAFALVAVTAGEAAERSRSLRGLRGLGAAPGDLWRAHSWATGAPVAMIGLLGVACGLLAALALNSVDPRAVVEWQAVGWLAVGCLAVGVLATVLTWPSATRTSDRSAGLQF